MTESTYTIPEGEQRRFAFTPTGGQPVTVTAEYEDSWRGGITPCIELEAVADILEAWAETDPEHRRYRWPSTERSDDDCFFAYLDQAGHVVLDSWKVGTESDHFPLSDLASLLPGHHFTLARATDEY